jgi:ABC-type polysaccharide/polyol phosphate export permease
LQPIAMTLVLSLVYSRLFHMPFREYGPLLLTGFAFWNYFSSVINISCSSLLVAEPYIRQQSLPTAIFPLRTVLMVGFHFLISLLLALGFVWVVNGPANLPALASLVPTLLLLFFFGWSLSVLMAYSHVYFPDTQHLAEVGLQVLFFLTPIMYPSRLLEENGLAQVVRWNPLARLLALVREPILQAQVPSLAAYSIATAGVLLLVCCAIWVLARLERHLVFAL